MNASYLSLSCSLHTRHTAEERSALLICEREEEERGGSMSHIEQ